MQPLQIPLFPLSAHLLPGGRMSLRLFEPRYVRMIKEVCAQDSGFGVCMLNVRGDKDANEHIHSIGTYAKVIDFDLLDDGLLGITAEGTRCFEINRIETESDGLRLGDVTWLDSWQSDALPQHFSPVEDKLKEIFAKYPEVNDLYQTPKFDDPVWVIYRWLEILPVNAEQKQFFLQQKDCHEVLKFLSDLVQ